MDITLHTLELLCKHMLPFLLSPCVGLFWLRASAVFLQMAVTCPILYSPMMQLYNRLRHLQHE